ncbi:MAG: hypothetical protein AABY83_03570 [Pseudomonadota bacterium]
MTLDSVNLRCIDLFFRPRVQALHWPVDLFWRLPDHARRDANVLREPSVNLFELEVLLSTAANVPSLCAQFLDLHMPNRGEFIRLSMRRGRIPMLSPACAAALQAAA